MKSKSGKNVLMKQKKTAQVGAYDAITKASEAEKNQFLETVKLGFGSEVRDCAARILDGERRKRLSMTEVLERAHRDAKRDFSEKSREEFHTPLTSESTVDYEYVSDEEPSR